MNNGSTVKCFGCLHKRYRNPIHDYQFLARPAIATYPTSRGLSSSWVLCAPAGWFPPLAAPFPVTAGPGRRRVWRILDFLLSWGFLLLRLAEWELGLKIKIKAAINDQRVLGVHLKTNLANTKRFSSMEVHQSFSSWNIYFILAQLGQSHCKGRGSANQTVAWSFKPSMTNANMECP